MALFQVHPHFGYLNSDVRLINHGQEQLRVADKIDGKEYTVPASSSIGIRLTAGIHKFTLSGEDAVLETIVVEDAIKLGGSKEKKSYIFEGTPWVLMVMLDRTYFYNRDTHEQYLEHGLAPQKIQFLTPNYLLFVSDKDHSIFSLDTLTVEKTIGDTSLLYSNEHFALFSIADGIALFSLDRDVNSRYSETHCNDYIIDKAEQTVYYHTENNRQITIKHLDSIDSKEEVFKFMESFRCLIGNHSLVYGNSPQTLRILNLKSKKFTNLYDALSPVDKINDKVVWNNNAIALIENEESENAYTSCAELNVYERENHWLIIKKDKSILKNKGIVSSKAKYTLAATNNETTYLETDQQMVVIAGKSFDCVKTSSEKGILIIDTRVVEYEGEPIVSPEGYLLIAKKESKTSRVLEDPLSPSNKYPSKGYETEELFKKTGLVKIVSAITNQAGRQTQQVEFHDLANNRVFDNDFYEDLNKDGFYRLSGGVGDYIHSVDGYIHTMPCAKDRLIAVSEHCNYALIRSEKGIEILKYQDALKSWGASALGEMAIDNSFYSKAVFCSDGENIIYQKKGQEYFLRRIDSDEESEFELQGSVIRRNFNGYIPYLDFDTHKRPVYVDPVSLTRIEAAAAGQFTFQSIDGKVKHVAHNVVKYYSYEKSKYVSEDEYKLYVDKYDYEINPLIGTPKTSGEQYEKAKINRQSYFATHLEWLAKTVKPVQHYFGNRLMREDSPFEVFLETGSVCDTYIFRKEYYVREKFEDEVIDILLPQELYFLNYVSYSYDNRYVIIAGRFHMNSIHKGLAMVYDLAERKVVYESTSTMAVWLGVFSKKGSVAYYDSTPITFTSNNVANKLAYSEIRGRSFLAFSPSGKYMALSCQGYIPYMSGVEHWGHQPSRNVYLVKADHSNEELARFTDHGESIENGGKPNSFVASATFSKDDKKLMTVSSDGVIVVRNLHLEEIKYSLVDDYPF